MRKPGLPAPAFFDRESGDFIEFKKVLNFFKPKSVFAKKEFSSLTPLSEENLRENLDFLRNLEKCESNREKIEKILSGFHEISASLKAVEALNATSVDLFEIKRFVYHHELLMKCAARCLENYFTSLQDVWELLSYSESSSYAFSPMNEEINRHIAECSKLQKRISFLYEQIAEEVEKKYGVRVENKRFVCERRKASMLLSSKLLMVEREGIHTYTFSLRPTEDIVKLENLLLEEEKALKNSQQAEIKRLCENLSEHVENIRNEIAKISKMDIGLAKLRGLKMGWSYPSFKEVFQVEGAFHPEIKDEIEEKEMKYDLLNAEFSRGLTMIFGPNMGGKTTVLKTIGLITTLAMYGFLVPAKKASVPHVDWIRYVGHSEGRNGLSSFAEQMVKIKEALSLPPVGLLLIDEFGNGTNPYEGESLATALASYLSNRENVSIMVTHYRRAIEKVECVRYTMGRLKFKQDMNVKDVSSLVDHTLIQGMKVELGDAILLAKVIGVPEEITRLADELLKN